MERNRRVGAGSAEGLSDAPCVLVEEVAAAHENVAANGVERSERHRAMGGKGRPAGGQGFSGGGGQHGDVELAGYQKRSEARELGYGDGFGSAVGQALAQYGHDPLG